MHFSHQRMWHMQFHLLIDCICVLFLFVFYLFMISGWSIGVLAFFALLWAVSHWAWAVVYHFRKQCFCGLATMRCPFRFFMSSCNAILFPLGHFIGIYLFFFFNTSRCLDLVASLHFDYFSVHITSLRNCLVFVDSIKLFLFWPKVIYTLTLILVFLCCRVGWDAEWLVCGMMGNLILQANQQSLFW